MNLFRKLNFHHNLMRNLKITHQFLILFGVLIIGFAAIGVAYKQVLDVNEAGTALLQKTNEFGDLVNQLSGHISEMHAEEKDFLITHDLRYVEHFETLIGEVEQKIIALYEKIPDEKARLLVTQVQEGVAKYKDAFDDMLNTWVLLGLDEKKGLHGEMRAAVHAVEDTVKRLGRIELTASMLQMRRHEKDFIQRQDIKYLRRMDKEHALFADLVEKGKFDAKVKESIMSEMSTYNRAFKAFTKGMGQIEARTDDMQTAVNGLGPLLDSLIEQKTDAAVSNLENVTADRARITFFFIGAIVVVGIFVAFVLLFLALRMRRSLSRLHETVEKVAEGDFTARSQLDTGDELGILAQAFDNLLDERVATQSKVEKENEQLNESIITLMASVAQLSQKDLTVKVEVAEDVTGPVSDAVNLMTTETTKVLTRIRDVAQEVEETANTVRGQAEKVTQVAGQERKLVQDSSDELRKAGITMAQLAKEAKKANGMADSAMQYTQNARESVSSTVGSIEQIREIIRETEKRIKRLGERSQEITSAVNLINTIAERTHILALNASMHAASAGEAGRGFAVVADEVQRLAESSRGATSDIASMVNAIRVETADTVDTMNRVIAQVADGTRLAQEAGERMGETETTTADLVAAVGEIASAAERQARSVLELTKRSQSIVKSTEQTSQELKEQSVYTINLVEYSKTLRESVGVFKLPAVAV
jgi:twitching motility protein PilJ